jgi:diacylglycerol O-acyltransferase / wax synthase
MPPRLSPLDGSFLRAETRNAPMHVAWAGLFEPPAERGAIGLAELRAAIEARLPRVPRFRQRLAFPPPGFGEPFWVDDPDFDVRQHVTALTEPGEAVTLASFGTLTDALLSEPLDRSRPLWHIYLVPRMEDGRAGLVGKMHHAMVDGVSVVEIGLLLFDTAGDAGGAPAWSPPPAPGKAQLAVEAVASSASWSLRAARATASLGVRPRRGAAVAAESLTRALTAVREDLLRPAAPSSRLNSAIGPERTLVRHSQPLERLREVRRAAGVKLNDVCLAVVSGALRILAEQGGREPVPIKAMIPVNVRGDDEPASAGNRISFVFVELPLDAADPRERLDRVHRETMAFKRSGRPAGAETVMRALGWLPGPLKDRAARLAGSARVFNVTVSNIPGPGERVAMLGAPLVEAYPVVPLSEDHALSIGMFSYAGRLFYGLYADPGALPEVADLPAALDASLLSLRHAHGAAGRGPLPPRDRPPLVGRARAAPAGSRPF